MKNYMVKMKKHYKILTFIYAVVLIWAIIFKMNNFDTMLINAEWNIDNIQYYFNIKSIFPPVPIPTWYFSLETSTGIINFLNIFAFIPFGFFVASGSQKSKLMSATLCSFLFSLAFEILQIFLFVGGFQLLDLAFNTLGGILGGLIFLLLSLIGSRLSADFCEKVEKIFVVICYITFTSVALYGTINTAIHIDFYIERQLIWMRAVRDFYQN